MTDYRTMIYKCYASRMQDASRVFDKIEAARWDRAYDSFLKEWLPENKDAAILEVACGKAVLASIDGYNGILCAPNERSWFNAISRVIDDNKLRNNISLAAHEVALSAFTEDIWRKKWRMVLEQIEVA